MSDRPRATVKRKTFASDTILKAVVQRDEPVIRNMLNSMRTNNLLWTDVSFPKTGDTAMHLATRASSLNIVKLLCEFCHSRLEDRTNCQTCRQLIEVRNKIGKRCLHVAAQICCVQVVDYLLRQGAFVDPLKDSDWTPLMLACCKAEMAGSETAQLLLDYGANPLLRNKDGWTPLHLATRSGWVYTVRLLLSYCPDAVAYPSFDGRTPLHIAALHGHKKVVEELLRAGSPVDPADSSGLTPMHEAVRGGHISMIRILKQNGGNVRKVDAVGFTCLHFAATTGRAKVIEYLMVEHIMFVDQPSTKHKLTPLHCAVRSGQLNCVKVLLNFGANPKRKDSKDRTAFDFCSGHTSEEIEKLLIARSGCL